MIRHIWVFFVLSSLCSQFAEAQSISRKLLSVLSYEKNAVIPEKLNEYEEGVDHRHGEGRKWNATKRHQNGHGNKNNEYTKRAHNGATKSKNEVLLFVHIAKTGGSSFDEILKKGVNNIPADCIVEKVNLIIHVEHANVLLSSSVLFFF